MTNNNTSVTSIIKRIISLALPMVASQSINVASGFLCMAMLAQLGHEVLAASALIFTTQLSIMVSGMSMLFSLSVLVGHAYGAKEYKKIGNYVQQGWTLGILISLPIIFLFWHIDTVLIYCGQSQEIAKIVSSYFHPFVFAIIPGFLSTCNMQFGYAVHKKKLILSCSITSVLVLLFTAYALIFGKFGFPQLGVAGLGYATIAQYSSFFLLTTTFFYFGKDFQQYELFNYRVHQHWEYFTQMLKIGWPITIQMGGEMFSFFVGGLMIGWLGTSALAAFQVVNQYYFLIVIPIFALSQASGILIGHARGAERYDEIKKLSYACLGIAAFASLCVALLFWLAPHALADFYLDVDANPETLQLAVLLFMVAAVSQFFDAIRNVFIGILRGLFDTRYPMLIALSSIWLIGMPLSYLFAFTFKWGPVGFLLGGMIGFIFGALMMFQRWYKLTKNY